MPKSSSWCAMGLALFLSAAHADLSFAFDLGLAEKSAAKWEVRGVADAPPELIISLAQRSEPIWATSSATKKQTTIRQILEKTCGTLSDELSKYYLSETLKLNLVADADEQIRDGAALAVPFCLKVERDVVVTIKPGDTPESILKENYGVFGPKTLKRFLKLNSRNLKISKVEDFATSLPIGKEVTVPWASETRIFSDVNESQFDLPELIASSNGDPSILEQFGNSLAPVMNPTDDRDEFQYKIVDTPTVESTAAECTQGSAETPPFDVALLDSRYLEEEKAKLAFDQEPVKNVVVGIIDTGLSKVGDDFFDARFFAKNSAEQQAQHNGISNIDEDSNGIVDDIFGMNVANETGFIEPFATSGPIIAHGTEMAAIILGGPSVAGTWVGGSRAQPVVRLKIVNIASATVAGANVGSEKMSGAIDYLAKQSVSVANMSLKNNRDIESVSRSIGAKPDVLFVVAAGNSQTGAGQDLRFSPTVFPARYGGRSGEHKLNVITVGAHDLKGKKAGFSNFSDQFVDLFAPGCSVPTRNDKGEKVKVNGTSPAAAAVSFTAALLRSLGIAEPKKIKNRLLVSVDVDSDLQNLALTSGRLNVIRAISIYHDVVTDSANIYLFSKITNRDALGRFCQEQEQRGKLSNIKKIRPNLETEQGKKIEYLVEVGDLIEKVDCTQVDFSDDNRFLTMDDGTKFDFRKVSDITLGNI
jgi:Subtilase family